MKCYNDGPFAPFLFDVLARIWDSIVSVPDHCIFMYLSKTLLLSKVTDHVDVKSQTLRQKIMGINLLLKSNLIN